MKLSNAVLLAALLMLGVGIAAAQDRDGRGWDNHDGYLQTVQYNGGNRGGADYQRGYQDGINSGRADANDHKRFDLDSHPYYTNSNDQAYREGFAQGYHEAYGQDREHPQRGISVTSTRTIRSIRRACRTESTRDGLMPIPGSGLTPTPTPTTGTRTTNPIGPASCKAIATLTAALDNH